MDSENGKNKFSFIEWIIILIIIILSASIIYLIFTPSTKSINGTMEFKDINIDAVESPQAK